MQFVTVVIKLCYVVASAEGMQLKSLYVALKCPCHILKEYSKFNTKHIT